MPTLRQSKPTTRRTVARKTTARSKRPFKVELTAEDIALDNAISAAPPAVSPFVAPAEMLRQWDIVLVPHAMHR